MVNLRQKLTRSNPSGSRLVRSDSIRIESFAYITEPKIMQKEAAAAKLVGSVVRLYDDKGIQFKTLNGTGATGVTVSGQAISITLKDGKVKLFDSSGRYIRTV